MKNNRQLIPGAPCCANLVEVLGKTQVRFCILTSYDVMLSKGIFLILISYTGDVARFKPLDLTGGCC